MNRLALAAALLGTVAAGGIAWSQTAPAPVKAMKPLKGDADADGRITRAEYVAEAEARFAALDTNRDGAITRVEARAGHKARSRPAPAMGGPFEPAGQDMAPPPPPAQGGAMRGPRGGRGAGGGGMARLDTDGDGRLSRAEYDAGSRARFARMDANGDGTADATELAALPGGARMAGRSDTDASGTLTLAEFTARSGERFDRMDGNGDGVVDAAEMAAGRGAGRPGGRGRRAAPAPTPTPMAPSGT